jgi:sedoheptulokinase
MTLIGLDIGTTSISTTVIDGETGLVKESVTVSNGSFLTSYEWEKIQDPKIILKKAMEVTRQLSEKYHPIEAIGLTGQMHGIVYVDSQGEAVSPLYTWQDGRGDMEYKSGKSYAEFLSEKTGYKLATGFGSVTHFYNLKNGLVPDEAKYFCTITNFIGMKLVGNKTPVTHISNAASFGMLDLRRGCFDSAAIEKAGMNLSMFPAVVKDFKKLGETKDNIPVVVAIGDNQASFIGSVRDMTDSILINVGTGSQISLWFPDYVTSSSMETRPCTEGTYLLAGSALCGGRSYAILENFFSEVVEMAGFTPPKLYRVMDLLSEDYKALSNKLQISTKFSGTRENPTVRGSITNLSLDNFTPQHFICGVLEGSVQELYDEYSELKLTGDKKPSILVGSGNGIRKSVILQQMFSEKFGMKVKIPAHNEEAAYGAALSAMVGIGLCKSIEKAQSIIRYEGEE